jgi:phosphomevalonate kinase
MFPAFDDAITCSSDSGGKPIVSKTGMGSSAALTTALVASLLQFFGVTRLNCRVGDEDRKLVHNLSQLAHAVAQGKLGSGFDVSAAVYGTQMYQRFDAGRLQQCMGETVSGPVLYTAVCEPSNWTQRLTPFQLPPMMNIVMGDVCGGSSSTSMAKDVFKWRSSHPEAANKLWRDLAEVNKNIFSALQALRVMAVKDVHAYSQAINEASRCIVGDLVTEVDDVG